jgi:hypothetical protein
MAKKNKDDWQCFDCGHVNSHKNESCKAPNHDIMEENLKLASKIRVLETMLSRQDIDDMYMTKAEFVEAFSGMLAQYLDSQYSGPNDRNHPLDLATATVCFAESFFIVADHLRVSPHKKR